MVPCHSCDTYGIGTSQSKRVWAGGFKVINWGCNASQKRGALFMGKKGSHYVILLYFYVLQGNVKIQQYYILLFTILLLL